jgi:hypothetical protein
MNFHAGGSSRSSAHDHQPTPLPDQRVDPVEIRCRSQLSKDTLSRLQLQRGCVLDRAFQGSPAPNAPLASRRPVGR